MKLILFLAISLHMFVVKSQTTSIEKIECIGETIVSVDDTHKTNSVTNPQNATTYEIDTNAKTIKVSTSSRFGSSSDVFTILNKKKLGDRDVYDLQLQAANENTVFGLSITNNSVELTGFYPSNTVTVTSYINNRHSIERVEIKPPPTTAIFQLNEDYYVHLFWDGYPHNTIKFWSEYSTDNTINVKYAERKLNGLFIYLEDESIDTFFIDSTGQSNFGQYMSNGYTILEIISELIDVLPSEKDYVKKIELERKVKEASKLKAYEFYNDGLMCNSTSCKPQLKAKNVNQISSSFTIAANPLAKYSHRTLYMQLITPDNIIYHSGDLNIFTFKENEWSYTVKEEIEYQNKKIDVKMIVDLNQKGELSPGLYEIRIYCDDELIGKDQFTLD